MWRRERRLASAWLVALVGGALLTASPTYGQGPPATQVMVDAVRLERVQEQRMVTGELRPVRRARIAAQEPGLVAAISLEEGQVVRAGDVLAKLDSTRLELDLQEIQAQAQVALATVEEYKAEVAWRERDVEMHRGLAARGAGNPRELSDAESQALISRAKLAGAQQQVAVINAQAEHLRKRLSDMTIAAPFDGVLISKAVEIGEWVEQGAAVAEMISTGEIDAWLAVPQQYAQSITNRDIALTINIDSAGVQQSSSQLRIVPQIDSGSRTFPLIVRLANERGVLAAGMSITGWVPTGEEREQLTISRNAVLRNQAGPYVYVVRSTAENAPSVAEAVPVQVQFGVRDRLVIRSGALQPGDQVVVEGNERLFPGMPVMAVPAMNGNPGNASQTQGASGGSGLREAASGRADQVKGSADQ